MQKGCAGFRRHKECRVDKITIGGAGIFCNLGVTERERRKKQEILVDIELYADTKKAAKTGKLKDTVNYSEVHKLAKEIAESGKYHLIESLAESIANCILKKFKVSEVLVRIKKPRALAGRNVQYSSIEIIRRKK